jgi:hypothetical protein
MTPGVRIAAACVSKDADDILPVLVAHYIRHGIRDFYLVQHGDQPDVSEKLVATMGKLANFTIYHHNNPYFRQAAMTNMLLELARADGFDVFLPFDSDEFFDVTDAERTLGEVLDEWVRSNNGEQLIVPMFNYLAPRDTEVFGPQTLRRITHRVRPKVGVTREQLSARMLPLHKSIARLRGSSAAELANVVLGNHETLGPRTLLSVFEPDVPSVPGAPASYPVVVRHLPRRSRAFTMEPLLLQRALETSVTSGESPEAPGILARLEATWQAFSLDPAMDPHVIREEEFFVLEPDDACARILDNIDRAGFDTSDARCRSTETREAPTASYSSQIYIDDPAFDAGVSATHVQFLRAKEIHELAKQVRARKDARIKNLQRKIKRRTARNISAQQPPAKKTTNRLLRRIKNLARRFLMRG